jgi:2-dehydro-3-deoxygluconokinase
VSTVTANGVVPEVITLGECMVLLVPPIGRALADAETLDVHCAGAESTVALYLADLGHPAAWVSRVGEDPWGDRVLRVLARSGVAVEHVTRDPDAPTGVFFKDAAASGRVYYYRRGSAASRLHPDDLAGVPVETARAVHVSGITPALGPSAAETTRRLLERSAAADTLRSFDVNHRAGLWPAAEAAPVLLGLTGNADLVFVGRDEAQTLWDTTDAESIRALLGRGHDLVVKDAHVGATLFVRGSGEPLFVAAPAVDVVEPVGAGDAFAAGYLAGWLRGAAPEERLVLAHRVAGLALGSTADHVDATALRTAGAGGRS